MINIILTQLWGKEKRNQKCQKLIYDYIDKIEDIVKIGISKGQIKGDDAKIIATEIYGLICSTLVYKMREREKFDISDMYNTFESTIIKGLKRKCVSIQEILQEYYKNVTKM